MENKQVQNSISKFSLIDELVLFLENNFFLLLREHF